MAGSDMSVGTIAAAIAQEGLSWTAAPSELTALSAQEQRLRLGLVVTDEEQQQLAQELRTVYIPITTSGNAHFP